MQNLLSNSTPLSYITHSWIQQKCHAMSNVNFPTGLNSNFENKISKTCRPVLFLLSHDFMIWPLCILSKAAHACMITKKKLHKLWGTENLSCHNMLCSNENVFTSFQCRVCGIKLLNRYFHLIQQFLNPCCTSNNVL